MAKNLSDSEAEAIYSAIARGVKTYEQVVEVCSGAFAGGKTDVQLLTYLPAHIGGLAVLGHGLHHRWPGVWEHAVDIFLNIQEYPVSRVCDVMGRELMGRSAGRRSRR